MQEAVRLENVDAMRFISFTRLAQHGEADDVKRAMKDLGDAS